MATRKVRRAAEGGLLDKASGYVREKYEQARPYLKANHEASKDNLASKVRNKIFSEETRRRIDDSTPGRILAGTYGEEHARGGAVKKMASGGMVFHERSGAQQCTSKYKGARG